MTMVGNEDHQYVLAMLLPLIVLQAYLSTPHPPPLLPYLLLYSSLHLVVLLLHLYVLSLPTHGGSRALCTLGLLATTAPVEPRRGTVTPTLAALLKDRAI